MKLAHAFAVLPRSAVPIALSLAAVSFAAVSFATVISSLAVMPGLGRATALSFQVTSPANATQIVLIVDPAQSTLHWTLDSTVHTVHGSFAIKSGKFEVNPETNRISGEIRVDAESGQSGNQSRDTRMHSEILESQRFAEVIFRPTRILGKLPAANAPAGDLQLQGTLTLRGHDHEINVPVRLELTGDHWKGTAAFQIPYVLWGLKDPSNFLLRVAKVVNLEVQAAGSLQKGP